MDSTATTWWWAAAPSRRLKSSTAFPYQTPPPSVRCPSTRQAREARYKAKSFIDMFVQRAAKVLAVGLNLALSALVVMHFRWLGREFRARADEPLAAARR